MTYVTIEKIREAKRRLMALRNIKYEKLARLLVKLDDLELTAASAVLVKCPLRGSPALNYREAEFIVYLTDKFNDKWQRAFEEAEKVKVTLPLDEDMLNLLERYTK